MARARPGAGRFGRVPTNANERGTPSANRRPSKQRDDDVKERSGQSSATTKRTTTKIRTHASNMGRQRKLPPIRPLADVLTDIDSTLRKFIVFSGTAHSRLLALWIAHCHAIEAAYTTPIINIYSPAPEAGKSTLLELLRELLPDGRALLDIDMSPASLYRLLGSDSADEPEPYVLLLDEADAIFRHGSERGEALRPILNAGYRRGLSVTRCIGKEHTPTRFYVFGPKVISGLDNGGLPNTVLSRRIAIPLKKRLASEKIERYEPRSCNAALHKLRDELAHALDANAIARLKSMRPENLNGLRDRQLEVVEPLIALADLAGEPWPEYVRDDIYAGFDTEDHEADATTGTKLLADIRIIRKGVPRAHKGIYSEELCNKLNDLEERKYSKWNAFDGIRPQDVASILKPFGIAPKNVRLSGGQRKGYQWSQFSDAWKRYCARKPGLASPLHKPSRPSRRPTSERGK